MSKLYEANWVIHIGDYKDYLRNQNGEIVTFESKENAECYAVYLQQAYNITAKAVGIPIDVPTHKLCPI